MTRRCADTVTSRDSPGGQQTHQPELAQQLRGGLEQCLRLLGQRAPGRLLAREDPVGDHGRAHGLAQQDMRRDGVPRLGLAV